MPFTKLCPLLHLSICLYRIIVHGYPASLRESYQDEMVDVFEQEVTDAWAAHGLHGVLRVWIGVGLESLRIVLPHQAGVFAVPVSALLVASTLLYAFCAVVISPLGVRPYCR